MTNPFVIYGYVNAEYFCDRKQETSRLIKYLTNGNNIVLSAPRRIGKTDLISHVFAQPAIANEFITISIDIYSTKSFNDFVALFGKAITDALMPRGRVWVNRFLEFVSSLKSQISFDINGLPQWSMGIGQNISPEITLEEIFRFINASETPYIIAIDEFQQITRYKEAWQAEALLRTYIQKCVHSRFIFSGSHRHLMAEIFSTPSRPFYASSLIVDLPLIAGDVYAQFCEQMFRNYGKTLHSEVAHEVYKRFGGVTAYMHRVMNVMFSNTAVGGVCDLPMIDEAINEIINVSGESYTTLRYQLTDKQYAVLSAIAHEGQAENVQGIKFIRRYKLSTPSSVMSAVKILLDRDLITRQARSYTVYDQFFALWILRQPQF